MTEPIKRLSRLRNKQHLLYLGIFSLVAVLVWTAGSLISSQQKTGITAEQQALAKPLNPNIDQATLVRLENKRSFSQEELNSFFIKRSQTDQTTLSGLGSLEALELLPLTPIAPPTPPPN